MKNILIILALLLPITLSAQLLNSYGVVEIGASFPLSSTRGAKFAYRTVDSSFYRWTSGNTWVKIVEPSIVPDTLYLTESIGTSYKVSGDTINLTPYLIASDTTAMLVKYIERGDTAGMLTNYSTKAEVAANPTTIAANYIATSNGSNLVARNLFDNNTYVGILNSKPFQLGQWTTAGRPTGMTGYDGYNTSLSEHEFYSGSDWYFRSPWKQSTSSSNVFLNSGSAIVNTSSVINSNYKLQVAGAATYRNASFTSNESVNGFLDIRGGTMTALSGSTHSLVGINIEGNMIFNTLNQTYTGIRISTNSNATSSQYVFPLDITVNSNSLAESKIINTTGGSGIRLTGASTLNSLVLRSPDGGTSGAARNGITFSDGSASPYSWGISGGARGMVFSSNATGSNVGSVSETMLIKGQRVYIGIYSADPTAKLEVRGDGSTSSTYTAKFQNTTLSNNGFMLLDDGRASFGVAVGDASAKVTVSSTTQGILPPRWTQAQRASISSPGTGLFGYQTDGTEGVYFKQASAWKRLLWDTDILGTPGRIPYFTSANTLGNSYIKQDSIVKIDTILQIANQLVIKENRGFGLPSITISNAVLKYTSSRQGSRILIGGVVGNNGNDEYSTIIHGSSFGGNNSYFNTIIGYGAGTLGDLNGATLIGNNAQHRATNGSGVAIGRSSITDRFSNSIGSFSIVTGSSMGSYGHFNTISGSNTIFIGNGVTLNDTNTVAIGDTTQKVRFLAYGTSATTAATLDKTESGYLASFATDGTVTSYKLARDTFIEDVTLFSVGTLMNSCQELTVVSSMTNLAPANMEIRFPDAADYLRGKKIIVTSIRKDVGAFIPQIKVVGGVSRLFYTTNTLTTAPTSQSGLDLDGSTWPQFASYEFTCLKINSTDYRWVLKQR